MQTLKLSVSLTEDTHPAMELRLSANDSDCDVVIALPPRPRGELPADAVEQARRSEQDDYVLGGYAGI